MTEEMRVQKYLSRAGRASRREAERLMREGRVRINGQVVTELGVQVLPGHDRVELDGEVVELAETRWILFHKPSGALTTRHDPHGGRTVYDLLPDELGGLAYVGRLDKDAEGLLLLTNDGELAHRIQHPSGEVQREYWVEAAGTVDQGIVRALRKGVELEDGLARALRVKILDAGPVVSHLTLVLAEGRKREVRRMMGEVGHHVLKLRRLRFGPITLGDLPRGEWRPLNDREVEALRRAAGSG